MSTTIDTEATRRLVARAQRAIVAQDAGDPREMSAEDLDDALAYWVNGDPDATADDYLTVLEYVSHFEWITPTRAVFRSFTVDGTATDPAGVIALFPDVPWRPGGIAITSYMHHGQHDEASPENVAELYTVHPDVHAPLVAELEALGYVLEIDTAAAGTAPNEDAVNIEHNNDATELVADRRPFSNVSGTFRGGWYATDEGPFADGCRLGALPERQRSRLLEDAEKARHWLYVVHSFDTPILWGDSNRLTIPAVCYSLTSSRHLTSATGERLEDLADGPIVNADTGHTPSATPYAARA